MIEKEQLDNSQRTQSLLSDLNKRYVTSYDNLTAPQQKQSSKIKIKNKYLKLDKILYIKLRDKFNNNYLGPYKIINRNTNVNFKTQHLQKPIGKICTIHVDRLLLDPTRKQVLTFENSNLS